MMHQTLRHIISFSNIQLALLTTLYCYALNWIADSSTTQLYKALLPAALFFFLLILVSPLHRFVFKLILICSIAITSISVFYRYQDNIYISSDIILSGLVNDVGLTTEMLSFKLFIWFLFTCITPSIILFFLSKKKQSFKQKSICYFGLLISSGLSIFTLIHIQDIALRDKGQIRDSKVIAFMQSFSPINTLYEFKRAKSSYKKIQQKYANVELLSSRFEYSDSIEDLLIIFVLGESTRGDHFSLNGYKRPTNPYLSTTDNLISFENARSCDTLTLNSAHCMMSPMLASQPDRYIKQTAFTEVLSSLGYSTEIYSLQTISAFYNYLGFDKLVSKYEVLRKTGGKAIDTALLPFADKAIEQHINGKKLIFLHTLGSHQLYDDRTSMEQKQFTPYCQSQNAKSCSRIALKNAYDNTVLMTDTFLKHIITKLQNKKAILVYVSDHGESLGENNIYGHGTPVQSAPKEQFSVPFIFWFSPSLIDTNEGRILFNKLKQKDLTLPISHDNLFHSLLGCSGVTSKNGGIDHALNLCQ